LNCGSGVDGKPHSFCSRPARRALTLPCIICLCLRRALRCACSDSCARRTTERILSGVRSSRPAALRARRIHPAKPARPRTTTSCLVHCGCARSQMRSSGGAGSGRRRAVHFRKRGVASCLAVGGG
jgi:hypothetical protein